jgi:aminopeptidase N
MRIASDEAGKDLSWFFEVYARRGPLPVLVESENGSDLLLEWQTVDELPFPMPIPVRINGELQRIEFQDNSAILAETSKSDVQVDPFMQVLRKLPIVPTCEERRAEEAEKARKTSQ